MIMSSYVALYRKYRPKTFDDIVGQDAIVKTLKNQIQSGKIGHAYLFSGMRGTGKTSTARVLSKALNCAHGPIVDICNKCSFCTAIDKGNMIDVIEMDAASNRGIDDIRELRDKVNFPPAESRYKVYIIDEVHMLTTEAFNALLKTLEEPPSFVVFILATTEPDKLPDTILSRCMRFDFRRVSTRTIVAKMEQILKDSGMEAERKALALIAENSQGSMRDALSILDKAIAFGKGDLKYEEVLEILGAVDKNDLFEISQGVIKQDAVILLDILDDLIHRGKDIYRLFNDLMNHFRNLLMITLGVSQEYLDIIDEDYERLQVIAKNYTKEKLINIIEILNEAENDMKWTSKPRIAAEAALAKLTMPQIWQEDSSQIARIQELEQKIYRLENTLNSIKKEGLPPEKMDDPAPEKPMFSENKKPTHEPKQKNEDLQTSIDNMKTIKNHWQEILSCLGQRREKVLETAIMSGNIRPYKINQNHLSFICTNKFSKDIFESKKKVMEEIIYEITNLNLHVSCIEAQEDVSDEKVKKNPSELFAQGVIDFFGEDIVEFEQEE